MASSATIRQKLVTGFSGCKLYPVKYARKQAEQAEQAEQADYFIAGNRLIDGLGRSLPDMQRPDKCEL